MAKILFVSDFQRVNCAAEGRAISEGLFRPLDSALKQAGIFEADYSVAVIHPRTPKDGKTIYKIEAPLRDADVAAFRGSLAAASPTVIVPLGEYALNIVCGLEGIGKWHCSVVKAKAEFGGIKCVPLLHPDFVAKSYADSFYIVAGCQKLKKEMHFAELREPKRNFVLGPSFSEALSRLAWLEEQPEIAIDIETGSGLINTVGFATSAEYAIAIKTLPEFYSQDEYLKLWQAIARVCEGRSRKIAQNFIYEATWLSRYGILLNNTIFDTMWGMKFLHPEFDKGLDNVGRLYTEFPYWKDDNDSWSNIRDWYRHLDYNCKDTTGTFAAYLQMQETLRERKLSDLFNGYVMRFAPVIQEMCTHGLLLDEVALQKLRDKLLLEQENHNRILEAEFTGRLQRIVNPRSPKQLQAALKDIGLKLPTKTNKQTGEAAETADKKALVKLRKRHPNEPVLPALIGLSATNKQLSSYANFEYDSRTKRVHYTLDGCGTETGRWAGYNSGWGEGFNPQTVPKVVRNCFVAEPGTQLVQIDLAQAESRFVAWESPEPTLMQMLSEGRDVHRYMASRIFKKPEEFINYLERQLGKKSGHASNYSVGPRTFAESCLVEMNYYIEEREAKRIIETYFEVFPGIRIRQANIRKEVAQRRMLRTPMGRERHFYGRMNDATFREAYAYSPQSVIPDITNTLMLKLWDERDYLDEDMKFLLQVHDSLLLQVSEARVAEVAAFAKDTTAWHPEILLPGGKLVIPTDVEVGMRWGRLEKM